jgi:TP901 family phage tail tape measure protein
MVDRNIRLGTVFTAEIGDFIAKTDVMIQRLNAMNVAMGTVGKGVNFSKLVPGMAAIGTAAQATTQALSAQQKQLGTLAKGWGGILSALKVVTRYGIASQIIRGVSTAFTAGKDAIVDYDQSLKNLQAVTQSTNVEVEKMGAEIKKVSSETRLNAQEIAAGMVLIGQAGFDATQSIQTIRAAADLSVGTLEDMALSTDLLTSAIFAFQTRALESTRVADIMANAINRSKLTLDKLRVAFNYVGAIARDAGVSMEETAAAMSILSNNGIRASTIGTGLRQVLARLLSPGKALREEFEEMGLSLEEMNPATQGFDRVMRRLAKVLSSGKDGAIDISKAFRLFGLRGAQTAAILSRSFLTGSYEQMLKKMYEVGAAGKMAEKQMEGLGAKLDNLASRMKLVAIAFGEAGITDAVKMLVDVLREAAKVLAEFLNSQVGKAIVSFGVWAASVYLLVRSFTLALSVLKWLGAALGGLGTTMATVGGVTTVVAARMTWFGKLISGMGNLLRLLWVKLAELWKWMTGFGTATATTSAVVRVATFSFKGLLAALGLTTPWGIAVTAILGVVFALKTLIQTTDQALKKQAKVTDEAKTNWEHLNTYRTELEKLSVAQSRGENITASYAGNLQRLKLAYPSLTEHLKDSVEALNENVVQIQKFEDQEFDKYINSLTKEIDLYQKSIKETATKQGYLTMAWEGIKSLGGFIAEEFKKIGVLLATIFGRIPKDFLEQVVIPMLNWIKKLHEWFGMDVPEGLKNAIDDAANAMSNLHKKAEQAGMKSDVVKSKMEELTAKYVEFGRALATVNKNMTVDAITAVVREMGASEEAVQAVRTAIQELRVSTINDMNKMVESIGKLPDALKEFYEALDPADKVKFVDMKGRLDKEIAEYTKKAKAIGVIEKDIERDTSIIRANGLARFINDTKKEEMTARQLAEEKVKIIEEYYAKEERLSKESLQRAKADAEQRSKSFEQMGMGEAAKKVMEEYSKYVVAEEERMAAAREGTRAASTKIMLEYETTLSKETQKLFKEQVKSFQQSLKERSTELRKIAAETRKEIIKFQSDVSKEQRSLAQANMTDEQKFLDSKKRIQDLYFKIAEERNKKYWGNNAAEEKEFYDGMKDRVQSHFEEIKNLAGGLATEVKDTQGRVVQSADDGTKAAMKALEEVAFAQKNTMQGIAREAENSAQAADDAILDLEVKIRNYMKTVDEASKKKLELQTTEAIQALERTLKLVTDFKKKWDELKSKTITLTVKKQESGSSSSSSDSGGDDDGGGGDEHRKGGFIEALKMKIGGAISSGIKKFGRGMKLPGYGGGDKVKALLEPGEFVIRKEAVSKYGQELFEMLNGMDFSLPDWLASKMGGIKESVRMSKGGAVGTGSVGGGVSGSVAPRVGNLKVVIKPRYMSGDRATARKFAMELQQELDNLEQRRGRR